MNVSRSCLCSALAMLAACGSRPDQPEGVVPVRAAQAPVAAEQVQAPTTLVGLLDRAPRVRAAARRAAGARSLARAAGVLPDPVLTVEGMRDPTMRENGAAASATQTFPRWGERSAMKAMAAAEAAMADAELAMVRGQVLAEVSGAYSELAASRARGAALVSMAERADALADLVTRSAIAAGRGGIGEALSLTTRAQSLRVQAAEAERGAADASGRIRAVLGLTAAAPLPEPMEGVGQVDPARSPEVALQAARRHLAEAEAELAASRGRPEIGIEVGWEREVWDGTDEYRAGLMVSVPIWRRSYAESVSGSRERAAGAVAESEGARLSATELVRRAERAREQARRARTFADATKQRLEAELQSVIAGLSTGEAGATAMLFDRFDQIAEAELMAIEVEASAAMAASDLWMVAPPPEETP